MSETRPPSSAEVECANCGRRFVGAFCPDCGQEDRDLDRPVRGFVREALSDVFDLDARIWRTLPLLVTNPGRLAREYADGRRRRYVPPFRAYLFLAAIFFTVLATTRGGPLRFGITETETGSRVESVIGVQLEIDHSEAGDPGSGPLSRATREIGAVNDAVVATLSYVHFLLVPFLALVLKALWRRRYYLEHLVLATDLMSFTLLVGILVVGVYGLAGNPDPPNVGADLAYRVWTLLLLVAGYRSVRAMFAESRRRTLPKVLALFFVFGIVTALVVFAIFNATLWFAR